MAGGAAALEHADMAALLGAAIGQVDGNPNAESGLRAVAWELHDALNKISETLHPPKSGRELARGSRAQPA